MSTPAKDRAWKKAHAQHAATGDAAAAALAEALPPGRVVVWRHGDHLLRGEVVAASADGWCYRHARVKVRANASGREYWVHAARIMAEL